MHVIKIGGNELDAPGFLPELARAVAAERGPVVIVHGGGRDIAELQARLGLTTAKVDGLRVTDAGSLSVAQMVLSGKVNKQIVAALLAAGLDALGLSGVDRGLLRCKKKAHPTADLGFVGEIVWVRCEVIAHLVEQGVTPVVSPISLGVDGRVYNVNADSAAAALAAALNASLLDFVSDVPGVICQDRVVPQLTPGRATELLDSGVIRDGMVPKVQAALAAVSQGVECARIVNLAGLAQGGTTFTIREAA